MTTSMAKYTPQYFKANKQKHNTISFRAPPQGKFM